MLQTSRSSTDFSTIASDRVSYELPDMGGGRRSLDTILGPRRSMDARTSMDTNRTDAEAMVRLRRRWQRFYCRHTQARVYVCIAAWSLQAACQPMQMSELQV